MTGERAAFPVLPKIESVYFETVNLGEPFENTAARFSRDTGTVVLLSGGDLDCANYHLLAVNPWLTIFSKKNTLSIRYRGQQTDIHDNPLDVLDELIQKLRIPAQDSKLPVSAGLFGYFAYDLKERIETLPRTCLDHALPDMCLYAPSQILIHDRAANDTTLAVPCLRYPSDDRSDNEIASFARAPFFDRLGAASGPAGNFFIDSAGFSSTFTREEYMCAVEKVIDYLKAGDIYQANLSQRFETSFSGDTYALFADLYKTNPAPFFAFVQAGDHQIISTSPERFLKREGGRVETRPIKGTIARGDTPEKDRENGKTLLSSSKDDAELTMIVDLMRNDLSKATRHSSVTVTEHKRLEPYDNVFHLVSVVEGEIEEQKSSVDLLRAAFPGGSITGCPKIRSMEIIDELEPVSRHVYTGSIGYVSFHDTMDLSIAIRTATVFNNRLTFSVGGGIVFNSDPAKEYQETLDKGKTIMDTLSKRAADNESITAKAWVNGRMVPADRTTVSALSPGFQYGAGLFETIRADNGSIVRLDAHVSRLEHSWEKLFKTAAPDITWDHVIRRLLAENRLDSGTAAVKIILAQEDDTSVNRCFAAVFARPYVHRLTMLDKPGLSLVRYPYPRATPLADHKSLNYLYYRQAGRFAKANNADEAVIFNPDGTVSETNTCSIMAVHGGEVIIPVSDHVLDGVTVKAALQIMEQAGYTVRREKMDWDALAGGSGVILTNALMGAVPVLDLEGVEIQQDLDLVTMLEKGLFASMERQD